MRTTNLSHPIRSELWTAWWLRYGGDYVSAADAEPDFETYLVERATLRDVMGS